MTEPYVHAGGDGPPVVLVHGTFVGGAQSFGAQAPLAEAHRLLIVDRRVRANPSLVGPRTTGPAAGRRRTHPRPGALASPTTGRASP
jgi:pimeloyl-ACP methyl ester carboxylesterase